MINPPKDTVSQLKALVEAGDLANQDSWHVVGLPWNSYAPYINTESEDPHLGRGIIDVIEPDCIEGEDDEDIARQWQELKTEMHANMVFVSLAANSRPAIKAAIAEIEAMEKEIERLKENIEHLKKCAEFESDLQMQIINFGARYVRKRRGDTYTVTDAWEGIKQALGGNDE